MTIRGLAHSYSHSGLAALPPWWGASITSGGGSGRGCATSCVEAGELEVAGQENVAAGEGDVEHDAAGVVGRLRIPARREDAGP